MIKSTFVAVLFLGVFVSQAYAISPGEKAPEFALKNQDGKVVRLADQAGKYVLLYFYPKDETPGCTKEACHFRDAYSEIKKLNTVVFGVSRQDESSHRKFIAHHHLPFDLLVDADGAVAKKYGVGTFPLVGWLKRRSVLIGPDGKVIHYYDNVDPAKHAQEVIKDIRKAESQAHKA